MARGRTLAGLAGVGVVAVVGVGTLLDGGAKVKTAAAGGGEIPAASSPPAPYALSTLGPIRTAAQDAGGGGGGTGEPGSVAPPAVQEAQGSGSAQGPGGNDGRFHLSGQNLLDPSRSATTSGQTTLPNTLAGVGSLVELPAGGSSTGCAEGASSAVYYAVPLRVETVGFNGTPTAHIRISGSGSVTVQLEQMSPEGDCRTVSSGAATIRGGAVDVPLTPRTAFQFRRSFMPALVITAPGSHTISTSQQDPSFLALPGFYGV